MEAQSRFLQFQAELPRPIRRAIWIVGMSGIILCYLGLLVMALFGLALWLNLGSYEYSMITVLAVCAVIYLAFGLDKESPDEDTTQPLTPVP